MMLIIIVGKFVRSYLSLDEILVMGVSYNQIYLVIVVIGLKEKCK